MSDDFDDGDEVSHLDKSYLRLSQKIQDVASEVLADAVGRLEMLSGSTEGSRLLLLLDHIEEKTQDYRAQLDEKVRQSNNDQRDGAELIEPCDQFAGKGGEARQTTFTVE